MFDPDTECTIRELLDQRGIPASAGRPAVARVVRRAEIRIQHSDLALIVRRRKAGVPVARLRPVHPQARPWSLIDPEA